jgi:hypothetical protein
MRNWKLYLVLFAFNRSGDHTVKIIDCQTGNCLKVLMGHRRTPWVVSLNLEFLQGFT